MRTHLRILAAVTGALTIGAGAVTLVDGGASGASTSVRSAGPVASTTTVVDTGRPGAIVIDEPTSDPVRPADAAADELASAAATEPGLGEAGERRERLSAPTAPVDQDGPVEAIGTLSPTNRVPDGIDLTSLPGARAPQVGVGHGGPGGLSAGPYCDNQCIKSGVAYPRGFGAELVVQTKVGADLWLSLTADLDGDGSYGDYYYGAWSNGRVVQQSWKLDHLQPGTRYEASVAAIDEFGNTSFASGHFTTLSKRKVQVSFNDLDIIGGPQNLTHTDLWYRIGADALEAYGLGQWVVRNDVDRDVELALAIVRNWEAASVCEMYDPEYLVLIPSGDSDAWCASWNTATVQVDLDQIPVGPTRWTSHQFQATASVDVGGAGSLPPGYGSPRWFNASATATIHVSYS